MSKPLQTGWQRLHVASFWRSIKIVSCAFFGIRKGSESQEDMARAEPLHIVVAGIGLAIAFVLSLIMLVQWVVAN
ncbi:hypothetical protein GALL_391820 [mine drainage metagenome]|uniref:DUF2970 domain-containing protein n=1 Tax=mine drainage metagenome TaxID=410659 RepID=A0A1J5QT59_9ZZZZ